MMFKLGYNTNGFTSHALLSAIDIIASQGYESVAISVDHHALNPFDDSFSEQIAKVKERLEKHQLSSIIETGARFLLDPLQKHEPTLISKDKSQREIRIDFIEKCLKMASVLGSDAVSIWSGVKKPDVDAEEAWEWMVSANKRMAKKASEYNVPIGFEPEPGMFVETLSQYQALKKEVGHPFFKLTLDLGHAFITESNVCSALVNFKKDLVNIHLEDMKKDRHEHLFFGQGEMDFKPIFQTLESINYKGQVNIELSRNSHNAVETSARAIGFLNDTLEQP